MEILRASKDCDISWIAGRESSDNGWAQIWGNEWIYKYILPRVQEGDSILELGVGSGRNIHRLIFAGAEVTGVDQSAFCLDICQENLGNAGINANLLETDAVDFLNQGCEYDFIFMIDFLLHFHKTKAQEILSQVSRFVKPRGIVYLNLPSTLAYTYAELKSYAPCVDTDTFLQECGCSGERKIEPLCFFWPEEAELLLRQSGFKILHSEIFADGFSLPLKNQIIAERV